VSTPPANIPQVKSTSDYVSSAWRNVSAHRPRSVHLLSAMLFFVILATGFAHRIGDPHVFFWFLSGNFVFFFLIMVLAIRDFRKIVQRYFREHHYLYRETLGEPAFVEELGERIRTTRAD